MKIVEINQQRFLNLSFSEYSIVNKPLCEIQCVFHFTPVSFHIQHFYCKKIFIVFTLIIKKSDSIALEWDDIIGRILQRQALKFLWFHLLKTFVQTKCNYKRHLRQVV